MIDAVKVGGAIASCRREKGFTQEDLAVRLAVTPQAVSKWERGVSFPDIDFLPDISRILDISVDDLLAGNMPAIISRTTQPEPGIVNEYINMLLPDEILIHIAFNLANKEFCDPLIEKIKPLRKEFAKEYGILLPIMRIRDRAQLENDSYEICFRKVLSVSGKITAGEDGAEKIINHLSGLINENPEIILTRQMVKALVDNLTVKHPVLAEEITAKLSYGRIRRILVGVLKTGCPINDLVSIFEACDEICAKSEDDEEIVRHILSYIKM